MNKHLELHNEIHYLIALVSLIFKRPPESITSRPSGENPDSDISIIPPSLVDDDDDNDDDNDETEIKDDPLLLLDETEFEEESATPHPEDALNSLKRRALDRLAEVLARFKTAQYNQKGGKPRGKAIKNLDAKHVTSAVMIENADADCVAIVCAKNEGLDKADEKFLHKLSGLLKGISGRGMIQDGDVSAVFDIISQHNENRLGFYSDIICRAFNQASKEPLSNNTPEKGDWRQDSHSATPEQWQWQGIDIQPNSNHKSEISAPDCLSDDEGETLIRCVADAIGDLFCQPNNSVTHTNGSTRMKGFLKNFYAVIKHPKQRPALKSCIRQILNADEPTFRRVWNALLFMARPFHAAVLLVKLASKATSFSRVRFLQVPKYVRTAKSATLAPKSPTEVLEMFGLETPRDNSWIRDFKKPDTIENYQKRLRDKKTVHAEIQLIYHLESQNMGTDRLTGNIFPYIGCSKRCCFFCDLLCDRHGRFSARGTHETVFRQWGLPSVPKIPDSLVPPVQRFRDSLKDVIHKVVCGVHPLPSREQLRQSSAGLSTAAVVQRELPSFTQRPPTVTNLIRPGAVGAADGQVQFVPLPGEPGYARFMAPSMPHINLHLSIEVAELYKINHDRSRCGLEALDQMPPEEMARLSAPCRKCRSPATSRCSACRTWYCSKRCQRTDWSDHLFTCRVDSRPNAIDYLRCIVRRLTPVIRGDDREALQNSLLWLFADDYVCRTFGFSNCSVMEVIHLVLLYDIVFSQVQAATTVLRAYLAEGKLEDLLLQICQNNVAAGGVSSCPPRSIRWYLARRETEPLLSLPGQDGGLYEIWTTAIYQTISDFHLVEGMQRLAEAEVFRLFVTIQPAVWRDPGIDTGTSTWMNFGFCYCRTFEQREQLSQKYLSLAASGATFGDIVSAYETSTLKELMAAHGIDISTLEQQGVKLTKPHGSEYAVFRLMIGVGHALSGRHCSCFRVREERRCHWYFETHLDIECDSAYGFHLTNSWERWQLLNFYKYVFSQPGFDAGAMAAATSSEERGALERYLDTLVPDMRRKIMDLDRASSIMFPLFGNRIETKETPDSEEPSRHLACHCRVHDLVGPPGLCFSGAIDILDRPLLCGG